MGITLHLNVHDLKYANIHDSKYVTFTCTFQVEIMLTNVLFF